MAKLVKKFVRWSEVYGRMLAIIVLVSAVLVIGVWYAISSEAPKVQDDFGDASTSDVARRVANLSYEDAQNLLKQGDNDGARAVMQRLAPLSQASSLSKGHPLAHLWMARLFLGDAQLGILDQFPLQMAGSGIDMPSYDESMKPEVVAQGLRHLEAAVALDPGLSDARKMLAEWLLLSGKRNEAYEVLYEGVRVCENVSTELLVPLLHTMVYDGDELGLEEWNWHEFATLGRDVSGRMRGDKSARLCYIFLANVLQEYRLADVGTKKYASDFDEESVALDALSFYVKAVHALCEEEYDAKAVLDLLLEACRLDPQNTHYSGALAVMYAEYPELKQQLESGVRGLESQPHSVQLVILLNDLLPNEENFKMLLESRDDVLANPNLLVAYVKHGLDYGELVSAAQLLEWSDTLSHDHTLSSNDRHAVLMARGQVQMKLELWQHAAESFEIALAMPVVRQPSRLHAMIAQCYDRLGSPLLQGEHERLASNLK